MSTAPVGSATPKTTDKSTFPGIGLTCHFIAGATSENPELPGLRVFAKYVGRSNSSSRQGATPRRHRVFVPSIVRPPSRALTFTPFSLCRLPTGTTRLEFVTSGRSVAISSLTVGQPSACASTAPRTATADSKHIWRVRLRTRTLIEGQPAGGVGGRQQNQLPVSASRDPTWAATSNRLDLRRCALIRTAAAKLSSHHKIPPIAGVNCCRRH